jgi:hypothetical protein
MRYLASEKAEINRLVEQSALPINRTLEKLGIPRATFYRWCDLRALRISDQRSTVVYALSWAGSFRCGSRRQYDLDVPRRR